MSNHPDDDLNLGPDPHVTPSPEFSQALAERLELQRQVQRSTVGSPRLVPYLAVANATRAVEFYSSVFGAVVVGTPYVDDAGRVTHTELNLNGVSIYLSDEFVENGVLGPQPGAGSPVSLVIEVADADLTMAAAVASGAVVERPVEGQWDARSGWFIDPFGHRWSPTSHSPNPINQERT
jgi:PhnB protein